MPESIKNANSIPFLTLETDGKVYPQIIESKLENFCGASGENGEANGRELFNVEYKNKMSNIFLQCWTF